MIDVKWDEYYKIYTRIKWIQFLIFVIIAMRLTIGINAIKGDTINNIREALTNCIWIIIPAPFIDYLVDRVFYKITGYDFRSRY